MEELVKKIKKIDKVGKVPDWLTKTDEKLPLESIEELSEIEDDPKPSLTKMKSLFDYHREVRKQRFI
jgi:hypothetical protein